MAACALGYDGIVPGLNKERMDEAKQSLLDLGCLAQEAPREPLHLTDLGKQLAEGSLDIANEVLLIAGVAFGVPEVAAIAEAAIHVANSGNDLFLRQGRATKGQPPLTPEQTSSHQSTGDVHFAVMMYLTFCLDDPCSYIDDHFMRKMELHLRDRKRQISKDSARKLLTSQRLLPGLQWSLAYAYRCNIVYNSGAEYLTSQIEIEPARKTFAMGPRQHKACLSNRSLMHPNNSPDGTAPEWMVYTGTGRYDSMKMVTMLPEHMALCFSQLKMPNARPAAAESLASHLRSYIACAPTEALPDDLLCSLIGPEDAAPASLVIDMTQTTEEFTSGPVSF